MARQNPLTKLGVLFLLLTAAPAAAQRAMGGIICRCPGLAKPLGSAATCAIACGGASGGGSKGGSSTIGLELGQAIGAGIAESMRKSAARQKALDEQNRLNTLHREEERRAVEEARKRRLLGEMQGVESSPELTLMTDDEPVRGPSAPAPRPDALQAGGLTLMSDEDLPPPAPRPRPVETTAPAVTDAPQDPGETRALPLEAFTHQAAPVVTGEATRVGGETPVLLSQGSAPSFPANFGAQDVADALAPGSRSAAPDAFEYMRRAGGYVAEQGKELDRALLKKTAKKIVSTEYGLASVLINMHDLPELIGPKLVRASDGEMPPDEANLLLFESVNVLYNIGAAPNKVVAKMIEKKDAMKGVVAWGVDAATDKATVAMGRGIAAFAAEAHADAKFPRIKALQGSTAGAVDALLHEGNRYVVEKDLRHAPVKIHEIIVIAHGANKAARWDEK